MPDDQSLLEAKWASYPCTILEFAPPERVRIDLRLPLGRPERAALASLGLDRPFAVLTAENPFGENPEDEPTANGETPRAAPRSRPSFGKRARISSRAMVSPPTGTTGSMAWQCCCHAIRR
jgi:hypothetical protein